MTKPWSAAEYLASYPDLQAAYGPDPFAASWHWQTFGQAEGRTCDFDGMDYVAGYADLRAAFGVNPWAGALHYVQFGRAEGRPDNFDGAQYLANYADLRAAFGTDQTAAARHYIVWGAGEGRNDDAPPEAAPAAPPPSHVEPPPAPPSPPPPPGQTINGTTAADTLVGTPGNDTIYGGLGSDTMSGGAGADIFVFGTGYGPNPTAPKLWDGPDTIRDFQPGMDKLDFSDLISDKGYTPHFLGTAPLSTDPPFQRHRDNYSYIDGSFQDVEVRYELSRLADGSPVTTVLFDGPVSIQSAKFNMNPMDGNVDGQLNLSGHLTLGAGDFIL